MEGNWEQYNYLFLLLFTVLIGTEAWTSSKRGWKLYRLSDTISNISCGIIFRLCGEYLRQAWLDFVPYLFIFRHFNLVTLSITNPLSLLLLLALVDLCYYINHRLSHIVSILWAGHLTHHSSEDFNLSVALRQGVGEQFLSWIFYLPLALFFSPGQFYLIKQINYFYQYFLHTKVVGKLPTVIEYIFNTPSHHRAHHGSNPKYINKNFAGMFILWDRIFGTFQEEDEEVAYGLVSPLNTFNPSWAQFHHYIEILQLSCSVKGISNRVRAFLLPPGTAPISPDSNIWVKPPTPSARYHKFDPEVPIEIALYTILHFIIMVASLLSMEYHFHNNLKNRTLYSCFILHTFFGLTILGVLLQYSDKIERYRRLQIPEGIRLLGSIILWDTIYFSQRTTLAWIWVTGSIYSSLLTWSWISMNLELFVKNFY